MLQWVSPYPSVYGHHRLDLITCLKKKKEEHEVQWREERGSGSGRRERASEVNIFTVHRMNVSKNYYLQCLISTEIERKYAPEINMQMNGI